MTTPPGPPGYPPPPPQPYATASPQLPVPRKKSSALIWVLVGIAALGALVVAGAAALYFLTERDSTQASDVKTGDCLAEVPDSSRVLYVKTVACDQPHKGEVFAVISMPDGEFPGDAEVVTYTDRCTPALARHAPTAAEDPAIRLLVLYPTADSWQRGDRLITCIATSENHRTGRLE